MSRIRCTLLFGLSGVGSGCQYKCQDGTANCHEVEGGRYLALPPSDAGRSDPLRLLVFFHGYGSSAEKYAEKTWLTETAAERGYLLVLPDGVNNTWAHQGSPSNARDELAYMDAVMQDVSEHWELTETRATGGFSQGASMAWDMACQRGDQFSAFLPASGSFWEPLPNTCDAPVNLRHTHGTADGTMPMEGRPIGPYQQGDVEEGIAIWRAVDECGDAPDATEIAGDATCSAWSNCASGKVLQLCLHNGGHELPPDFLSDGLDWVEKVSGEE